MKGLSIQYSVQSIASNSMLHTGQSMHSMECGQEMTIQRLYLKRQLPRQVMHSRQGRAGQGRAGQGRAG